MITAILNPPPPLLLDKDELRRVMAEENRKMGFIPDPTASAQRARAKMLVQGVRPEDNLGSCGIIAAREGGE